MEKALINKNDAAKEFSAELHRAVASFVSKATKADIKELLKRAKSETFNKVATPRVFERKPGQNRVITAKFIHLKSRASAAQDSAAHESLYAVALASTSFTKATVLSATASNRHDLALAA